MSEPRLLTGREPARALRNELRERVAALASPDRPLTLAVVRVGSDEASEGYARQILRTCNRVGVVGREELIRAEAPGEEIVARVAALGAADDVHGILVQLPLPEGVDEHAVAEVIPPLKDVDRITPAGMGELFSGLSTAAPATAAAVDHLLVHYGIELKGKQLVIIGRSNIVGKPVVILMLRHHATVTVCHSRTVDLPQVAAGADVLIVAIGRKQMVDERYVKPGAVVVDVGTNYEGDTVYGDVDFDAVAPIVSAITPVPGGVGPLTNYCLIRNLVSLVERARSRSDG